MTGLLAVDVGNTQTALGLFEGGELTRRWRLATEPQRTGDELGLFLGGLLDLTSLEGICLASTVPALIRSYEELAASAGVRLLVLGPGTKTGIPIRYDDPREVGPDRIANAVAARERYGAPSIVVDFGTSTNFDVVSPAGEYDRPGRSVPDARGAPARLGTQRLGTVPARGLSLKRQRPSNRFWGQSRSGQSLPVA